MAGPGGQRVWPNVRAGRARSPGMCEDLPPLIEVFVASVRRAVCGAAAKMPAQASEGRGQVRSVLEQAGAQRLQGSGLCSNGRAP